jgi:hypothetical protein
MSRDWDDYLEPPESYFLELELSELAKSVERTVQVRLQQVDFESGDEVPLDELISEAQEMLRHGCLRGAYVIAWTIVEVVCIRRLVRPVLLAYLGEAPDVIAKKIATDHLQRASWDIRRRYVQAILEAAMGEEFVTELNSGPFAVFSSNAWKTRNKVVHSGVEVEREAAEQVVGSAIELATLIASAWPYLAYNEEELSEVHAPSGDER